MMPVVPADVLDARGCHGSIGGSGGLDRCRVIIYDLAGSSSRRREPSTAMQSHQTRSTGCGAKPPRRMVERSSTERWTEERKRFIIAGVTAVIKMARFCFATLTSENVT